MGLNKISHKRFGAVASRKKLESGSKPVQHLVWLIFFFPSCLKSREDIFLGLEYFDYPWKKGCVSPFLSILSTLSSAFLLYNLQCFAATVFCA